MPARELFSNSDQKFRLLFELLPQPMCILEPESQRILQANEAALTLYGYTHDEFCARKLADLDAGIASDEADTNAAQADAPVTTWRHRTAGGRVIELEAAIHDIEFGGRTVQLAVILDITGRRQLEEELRQAQKMEAVGMLAGGVAHDFNNLLTIISGYSQLMLANLQASDPNRPSLEQIIKAGERAAALTAQLLAFSRRRVSQPKVLDLNKLVTSLSTMLQRLIGEDIELRLVLPPDLGRLSADPGQIEQVLMNLVVNARDAMPQGGILKLETGNVTLDGVYAARHTAVPAGRYIKLAVRDNGSGMDEATKARLFEPFFTTKGTGKGTGLGLSTVFGIVKQSGGAIDVQSEPGKGTSIEVYLPRIDEPLELEAETQRRKLPRATETVLVVEDDEMVRTLVRETLRREGYKVLDAADPLDALRISDQFRRGIHLLITDVVMPKLSGRELAEQLSERRSDMRVLFMSGYTDATVLKSGVFLNEVAFLQKPFTPTALSEKVREVLEGVDERTHRASK